MMVSHSRVGRVDGGDGFRKGDWSRGVVGTKLGKGADGFRDFFRLGELLGDSFRVVEMVMRPVLGVIPAVSAKITRGMVERGQWTDGFGGHWHQSRIKAGRSLRLWRCSLDRQIFILEGGAPGIDFPWLVNLRHGCEGAQWDHLGGRGIFHPCVALRHWLTGLCRLWCSDWLTEFRGFWCNKGTGRKGSSSRAVPRCRY